MNTQRPLLRHIIIKMAKGKDKENLKGSKRERDTERQRNRDSQLVTYKGIPIRLSVDF